MRRLQQIRQAVSMRVAFGFQQLYLLLDLVLVTTQSLDHMIDDGIEALGACPFQVLDFFRQFNASRL